jgi:hypothetical protein
MQLIIAGAHASNSKEQFQLKRQIQANSICKTVDIRQMVIMVCNEGCFYDYGIDKLHAVGDNVKMVCDGTPLRP